MESGKRNSRVFTIPNIMSMFRVCLIPVIIWLYCIKRRYLLTAGVFLLSGITDVADGFIARRFNMVSDLGKALDPIADKLTQGSMLFCLLTRFPLMLLPFALMAVKEIGSGIVVLTAIRRSGIVRGAEWHGKVTTVMLYAMMLLHLLWVDIPAAVSRISIFACVAMMLFSMTVYIVRHAGDIRNSAKETESGDKNNAAGQEV